MPALRRRALFCALLAVTPTVFAELPADRDLIRDRQERVLQEQQKRLEELQQLPGKSVDSTAPAANPQGPCFAIRSIKLQSVTLISPARQAELLRPYEGQCLGSSQLNELLKSITQYYLDHGYVTSRAYLPQQDLADGELEVLVVEGQLEGLNDSAIASPRELAMAFPGHSGEVLDLRELEQMVDQLNRLQSRPAQLELVPGQAVGGSRVQLQGERGKPWQANLNRHNDGQTSTGEQQWGAGFVWDSPLGLADQLSLRGGGDTVSDHWKHSANQSLGYSLPYGWWTVNYSYSQSYYRTQSQGAGFTFGSDGDSKTHSLRAERVLHRDDVSKTAANLGISHLQTRNYLNNNIIDVSSQRLTESQLGFNHGRRIGNAFVNFDLGWQQGTGALDAQGDGDPNHSQPVARYNKYSLTASYLQPFTLWNENFSVDSLVNGQRSEDVLFSPQRISLGGLSSVRGFKEQSLSGDSGAYWRNQVRWRRPVGWQALSPFLQEYGVALAYDLGVIHGNGHNGDQHGRLSGNAIEFSTRGRNVAASVTFARSLERPDAIERQEHPLYFRFDLFF